MVDNRPTRSAARPADGFAIASLVCGLLGLVLFILACGVAALALIRRVRDRGAVLAVAGLALSAVWLGTDSALIFPNYLVPREQPRTVPPPAVAPVAPPPSTVNPDPVSANELGTFECFDATGLADEVDRVDCDPPHDEQIFGKSEAGWQTDAHLGDPALHDAVMADCRKSGQSYLIGKVPPPGLIVTAHFPTAAAWDAGTRSVACTFKLESGKLTGSLTY